MKNTTSAIIVGIVACFLAVVVACTVVFTVDSKGAADFITPLFGFAGTTLALIAGLAAVTKKVDDVKRTADYLANGGTDAKIRAAIADMFPREALRPEVDEMIEQDRATRDAGPTGPEGV